MCNSRTLTSRIITTGLWIKEAGLLEQIKHYVLIIAYFYYAVQSKIHYNTVQNIPTWNPWNSLEDYILNTKPKYFYNIYSTLIRDNQCNVVIHVNSTVHARGQFVWQLNSNCFQLIFINCVCHCEMNFQLSSCIICHHFLFDFVLFD
jgi:hypothetical protein